MPRGQIGRGKNSTRIRDPGASRDRAGVGGVRSPPTTSPHLGLGLGSRWGIFSGLLLANEQGLDDAGVVPVPGVAKLKLRDA